MRIGWQRIIERWTVAVGFRNRRAPWVAHPHRIAVIKSNHRPWKMRMKSKLANALCSATSALLTAQDLVKQPANREKLIQAELLVRMVMLSECPSNKPAATGHHGG